ncbi:hypothetical protein [Rhodopila sp.]|nr:hypothetical protein [Rhodopila sp.]HVZ09238.1 hypothetical protein [Rhodopila sp.]
MRGIVPFVLGKVASVTATGRAAPVGLAAALPAGVILVPLGRLLCRRR